MNKIKKLVIKHFPLIGILFFALFLRLIFLDRIPSGLAKDEIDFYLNGRSLWFFGKGFMFTSSPISLTPNYPLAELPSVIFAPIFGILPMSLFIARLPYVLLGVGSILLLYGIVCRLINKKTAIFVALAGAISPWSIFFTRTAYNAPFAEFFLLLFLFGTLYLKKSSLLFLIIPIVFAFHSYTGMMVATICFVPITSYYAWKYIHNKTDGKYFILLNIILLISVFRYISFTYLYPSADRSKELAVPWSQGITNEVNFQRKQSSPSMFIPITINKFTVFMHQMIERYFGIFNPSVLYLKGDPKYLYTTFQTGLLYLTDSILILFGFLSLYKTNIPFFIFLLCWGFIAPFPSAICVYDTSFALRSYLLLPVITIFIGNGASFLFDLSKKLQWRKSLIIFVCILYIIQIGYFYIIYFLKNPIANQESFNFSGRIFSRYVYFEHKKDAKIEVLATDPILQTNLYFFYSTNGNRNLFTHVITSIKQKTRTVDDIEFSHCIPDAFKQGVTYIIEDGTPLCDSKQANVKFSYDQVKYLTIGRFMDAGAIYRIINGKTCTNTTNTYPITPNFSQLNVEAISEDAFCSTYIYHN